MKSTTPQPIKSTSSTPPHPDIRTTPLPSPGPKTQHVHSTTCASTTSTAPSTSSPPIPGPLTASKTFPIRSASSSSISSSFKCTNLECSMPDGRRNSQGESLRSPIETWTPNLLLRRQTWNHQDLKRLHVEEVLKKEQWRNDEGATACAYSHECEDN